MVEGRFASVFSDAVSILQAEKYWTNIEVQWKNFRPFEPFSLPHLCEMVFTFEIPHEKESLDTYEINTYTSLIMATEFDILSFQC